MTCPNGADVSVESLVPSAQNSMEEAAGLVEALQSMPLVTVSPSVIELVKVGSASGGGVLLTVTSPTWGVILVLSVPTMANPKELVPLGSWVVSRE